MLSTSSSGYHRLGQEKTKKLWDYYLLSIVIQQDSVLATGVSARAIVSEATITTISIVPNIDTLIAAT